MELCTKLSERVLDLENTKTSQAVEITKLKERVKKLERRNKSRIPGLKRLRKGRKIADLDADAEVTLVDEAQGKNDDYLMITGTHLIEDIFKSQLHAHSFSARIEIVRKQQITPVIVEEPEFPMADNRTMAQMLKLTIEDRRRNYALDSAAGGNFLDKMPRDGLAIIESKSKVCYSRSRAIEPRMSTNAPLSTSTPFNSFEFQQLAASLEDKMDIRMSRLEKMD
ncbi:hypothetical protein Tco_1311713 [Tanacetum coccineum]